MFVEIDLGASRAVDRVQVDTSQNSETKVRLEGLDASGHRMPLNDQPSETVRPLANDLRRAATGQLRARGVRYLLVTSANYGSENFFQHADDWGLKLAAQMGATRLYHVE